MPASVLCGRAVGRGGSRTTSACEAMPSAARAASRGGSPNRGTPAGVVMWGRCVALIQVAGWLWPAPLAVMSGCDAPWGECHRARAIAGVKGASQLRRGCPPSGAALVEMRVLLHAAWPPAALWLRLLFLGLSSLRHGAHRSAWHCALRNTRPWALAVRHVEAAESSAIGSLPSAGVAVQDHSAFAQQRD